MSNKTQYCVVEHIWRLLRAAFLLLGTALWLYTTVSPHIIFVCFIGAVLVDQFHGVICRAVEKLLHYKVQHDTWE